MECPNCKKELKRNPGKAPEYDTMLVKEIGVSEEPVAVKVVTTLEYECLCGVVVKMNSYKDFVPKK